VSALATDFAISDDTFSLNTSPSWEGHLAMAAATQDHFYGYTPVPASGVPAGPGWGCDSDKVTQWVNPRGVRKTGIPSCVSDPALGLPFGGAFRSTPVAYVPTIMDRLDATGLSWRIYGATKGQAGYGDWNICPSFAECLDTSQDANLVPDSQFTADASAGTLPAFSVVTPGGPDFADSGHNRESITAMDNWLGQLTGAVMNGPEWDSTTVFITWDDCGCFYDQVPPPVAPDGSQEGPRVPMIIVSPYAKAGYTDTGKATFASVLAYTEQTFGLPPLGVNDGSTYNYANAFDYTQSPRRPVRMVSRPLPASARWLAHHQPRSLLDDPT
jgi:phospholipase C